MRCRAGRRAALGRPGFHVHDDRPVGAQQAGADEREQRQVGCGGVAADAAGVPRISYSVAVRFRQAIRKAAQPFGRGVWFAVIPLIGARICQPEIGGEVYDALGQPGEVSDAALRLAVGQRQEEHVARLELAEGGEADGLGHPGGAEVGMDAVREVAGLGFGGDLGDLDVRVMQQQAEQLAPAVTGTADDGDAGSVVHSDPSTPTRCVVCAA